jgi:hypothetical protein
MPEQGIGATIKEQLRQIGYRRRTISALMHDLAIGHCTEAGFRLNDSKRQRATAEPVVHLRAAIEHGDTPEQTKALFGQRQYDIAATIVKFLSDDPLDDEPARLTALRSVLKKLHTASEPIVVNVGPYRITVCRGAQAANRPTASLEYELARTTSQLLRRYRPGTLWAHPLGYVRVNYIELENGDYEDEDGNELDVYRLELAIVGQPNGEAFCEIGTPLFEYLEVMPTLTRPMTKSEKKSCATGIEQVERECLEQSEPLSELAE